MICNAQHRDASKHAQAGKPTHRVCDTKADPDAEAVEPEDGDGDADPDAEAVEPEDRGDGDDEGDEDGEVGEVLLVISGSYTPYTSFTLKSANSNR